MAKERFTVHDLEQELRRREAKATVTKARPKTNYPNADRYGEDGQRLYSTYDAAPPPTPRSPGRQERRVQPGRLRLIAIALAFIAAVLIVLVISALPH